MTPLALLSGPINLAPIIFVIIPLFAALWIWALVDCATKEPDTGNSKVVWILIIIFLHIFGALIYLVVRRPQRWAAFGR